MSINIHIAYNIDQNVQILTMDSMNINIYNNILNNINKIYQPNVCNIYMELLSEEEFNNIEECLNNSLRLVRPLCRHNDLNGYQQLWIHVCRTNICIVKPLNDCNISYKTMITAGDINDTFEMMFECNDRDNCNNCNNFMNRLCNHLMKDGRWASLKQYITLHIIIIITIIIIIIYTPTIY
jgi:hypothetical protein